MLLKLIFTKEKRFFYKIKTKKEKDFWIVTAPHPKNLKQKKRLILFLTPFEKRIIYPPDFCETDYPAPYPAFEIYCKKLISEFLGFCKANRPDIAVITPNGLIKESFYFDLSEYVGKIILKSQKQNNNLKSELLAYSGTVIEFDTEYDETKNTVAVLTMPAKRISIKM